MNKGRSSEFRKNARRRKKKLRNVHVDSPGEGGGTVNEITTGIMKTPKIKSNAIECNKNR
jgi:hypothetical protein